MKIDATLLSRPFQTGGITPFFRRWPHKMHWTEFEGILFVEETVPAAKILDHVVIKLHGLFTQAQLKNLNDIKHRLSHLAKNKRGNAIINFEYGQKSSFWTTLIGVDNVNWYGEGDVVVLSEGDIGRLKKG